jgi:hypothetical protein
MTTAQLVERRDLGAAGQKSCKSTFADSLLLSIPTEETSIEVTGPIGIGRGKVEPAKLTGRPC